MKDHRFNRLNDCALMLIYHLDDIAAYLDKYQSVVNGVSILDRTFADMDVLKPIFNAIALIGIHVTRPFHKLIMDRNTTYTLLLKAYPRLYEELKNVDAIDILQPNIQVFKFASNTHFTSSLPEQIILESLTNSVQTYPEETISILKILKEMIADGLHVQKGAIFSFGPSKDAETSQNVLKISDVDHSVIKTLDEHVPVHNIGEERNVGMVNYESSIRGKNQLKTVSSKLVINKSYDLLSHTLPSKYKKRSQKIEELRLKWTEKMKDLQKVGFEQQDLLNIKKDASKIKDLEYLKRQNPAGPFTSREEIENFMERVEESKSKNDRLYVEVRYARNTCLSMSNSEKFFKLRRNGKTLESLEYAQCLTQYLDNSRSLTKLTIPDLKNVLGRIQTVMFGKVLPLTSTTQSFCTGERHSGLV